MSSKEKLVKIKNEGFFTASQPFDVFVSELCKRYTRIYGEILPTDDYDYIVERLEEKGILEPEDDSEDHLNQEPIYL